MKKLAPYLVIIFLTVYFSPAKISAQEPEKKPVPVYNPVKQAENHTRWMSKYLDLTENQTSAVYMINLKYINRTDSLKTINSVTLNKTEEMTQTSQNRKSELQGVLSLKQYTKYIQVHENARIKKTTN